MTIYKNVTELIGNTPVVELSKLEKQEGLKAQLLAKVEFFNPAGSVKDRIAKRMIEKAEEQGLLKEGATIIEPTSGNTGIGLASVCASKGYKAIFTMPETMSVERRNLLKAYGAKIVLTPGAQGMKGAIAKAKELQESTPNSLIPSQFTNLENPQAHYETTGPELWEQNGWKDRYLCSRCRNGWNNQRYRKIFEGKESEYKDRCGRTGRLTGIITRESRSTWHPGNRRRICTGYVKYKDL